MGKVSQENNTEKGPGYDTILSLAPAQTFHFLLKGRQCAGTGNP